MSLKLGSNIAALSAQRNISRADQLFGESLSRLSSGMRINTAADDAAGLSVASNLNVKSRVYNTSVRNVNDAMSAISIVSGALGQLTNLTQRMAELASQSASGTYSNTQRAALEKETHALVAEYNRIVTTTEFNGRKLLNGEDNNVRIQAGYGVTETLNLSLGKELGLNVGDGTFINVGSTTLAGFLVSIQSADFNRDGITDLVSTGVTSSTYLALGNGNGTFRAPWSFSNGGGDLDIGDFNGDGYDDIIVSGGTTAAMYLNNGSGGMAISQSFTSDGGGGGAMLADINGDAHLDMFLFNGFSNAAEVLLGNGNGTFSRQRSLAAVVAGGTNSYWHRAADINGDGKTDFLRDFGNSVFEYHLGNGDGTFRASISLAAGSGGATLEDVNEDGRVDLIIGTHSGAAIIPYLQQSNGTFTVGLSFSSGLGLGAYFNAIGSGDFNGDGHVDLVANEWTAASGMKIFLGNGNGSFIASSATPGLNIGTNATNIADYNNDGLDDMMVLGATDAAVLLSNGNGTFRTGFTFATGGSSLIGPMADFNNDDVLDVAVGVLNSTSYSVFNAAVDPLRRDLTLDATSFSVATQTSARRTLDQLNLLGRRMALETGHIGALESRLKTIYGVIQSRADEYTAASGRIMNADVAEESANLVRTKLLREIGTSVAAQANAAPALVMQLLRD